MVVELKAPARYRRRQRRAAFARLSFDHRDATLIVHHVKRLAFEVDRAPRSEALPIDLESPEIDAFFDDPVLPDLAYALTARVVREEHLSPTALVDAPHAIGVVPLDCGQMRHARHRAVRACGVAG